MAKDTRERILNGALDMFSEHGYEGTNIRDLAASLSLGASSLYRHFESKEVLWKEVLAMLVSHYEENLISPEKRPHVPKSTEELFEMTEQMVRRTVNDPLIIKSRKILSIEQFRDNTARNLATKHFITGLTDNFSYIFSEMMKNGVLKEDDPQILAFSYVTPISSLILLCDREPYKKEQAEEQIQLFVRHFIMIHGKEAENA